MHPTCSQYAIESYQTYGIIGILLTIERLFIREHGNIHNRYIKVPSKISEHPRFYDPTHNSFQKPSFFQEDF